MADPALTPTRRALRAAGLLPPNQPEHHVASGDSVPPQPEPVSQVFGPVRLVGDKTLIDVTSVRYTGAPGENDLDRSGEAERKPSRRRGSWTGRNNGYARRSPLAVIEVSDLGIRVRTVRGHSLAAAAGLLAIAWNVYWVWRAKRG